jgi:hypothetical protein
MDMTEGRLVIFRSEDGDNGWTPIRPEEVPEGIRSSPEMLGRMVAGDMAQLPGESQWYAARRVADTQITAANDAEGGDGKLPEFLVRTRAPFVAHKPLVILPAGVKP